MVFREDGLRFYLWEVLASPFGFASMKGVNLSFASYPDWSTFHKGFIVDKLAI